MPSGEDSQTLSAILARLAALEKENTLLKEINLSPSIPVSQEPRVSLPEKFSGERSEFRTFINQLELVFMLNPSRYQGDAAKIATTGTLLQGVAASWFNPFLENPEKFKDVLNNWENFKTMFRRTFASIDPTITAANEISRLRQANGPVSTYVARFMQLRSDLNWNEDALIHQFRTGLSNEVKDLLLHHEHPTSLQEFTLLAIRIDGRLYEHRQQSLGQSRNRSGQGFHERSKISNPYSSALPPRQPNPPPITSTSPYNQTTGSVPMEIDSVRRGPLTQEERENRFKNNLCIVCGSPEHFKANCPQARKRVQAIELVPNQLVSNPNLGKAQSQ